MSSCFDRVHVHHASWKFQTRFRWITKHGLENHSWIVRACYRAGLWPLRALVFPGRGVAPAWDRSGLQPSTSHIASKGQRAAPYQRAKARHISLDANGVDEHSLAYSRANGPPYTKPAYYLMITRTIVRRMILASNNKLAFCTYFISNASFAGITSSTYVRSGSLLRPSTSFSSM